MKKVLLTSLLLVSFVTLSEDIIYTQEVNCYPYQVFLEQREAVYKLMRSLGLKSSEPSKWSEAILLRLQAFENEYTGQKVGVVRSSVPKLVKINNRFMLLEAMGEMPIYYEDVCRKHEVEFFKIEKCMTETLFDIENCDDYDKTSAVQLSENLKEQKWKRF